MILFYVIIFSLFFTALFYVIGKTHPNLLIFINLFVNILTLVYLIFREYGQFLIAKPINA